MPTVSAHGPYVSFDATEWYSWSDGPDYDTYLTMECDTSVPGGSCGSGFANQAYDGTVGWNYLSSGASRKFIMAAQASYELNRAWGTCYLDNDIGDGSITIFYVYIDGAPSGPGDDVIALINICFDAPGGQVDGANLKFDSGNAWDTDGTVTTDELDTLGVATHETGHAAGPFLPATCRGGHWDKGCAGHPAVEPSLCPGDSEDHTMCRGIIPNRTKWRTPEAHDEHTFTTIYA